MIVKMKCTLWALGLLLTLALPGPAGTVLAEGESDLLFIQLPRLPQPGEPALVVEFKVRVDQRLVVDERIAVDGKAAADGLGALVRPGTKAIFRRDSTARSPSALKASNSWAVPSNR